MSDLDFSGKTALVVGGSSGIGNAIAQQFYRHGAEVHVWGTRPSATNYAVADGSNLEGLHYQSIDATNYDTLSSYEPPFEHLDILVLSQGLVRYQQEEFEKSGWDEVMSVNIDSVMHTANKFKDRLSQRNGSIIIVNSVAAIRAPKGNPAYAASKAAAYNLTKALGIAWARDGIRVNGIAPGLVPTKMTTVTTANDARLEASLKSIPLRRTGTPDEMAGVALFLASPLASYVQGHTVVADGGMTL